MIDIRVHEQHAYVEIGVYGEYTSDGLREFFAGVVDVTNRHGFCNELEIHHVTPTNSMRTMLQSGNMGVADEVMESYFKNMRKYALVADRVSMLARVSALILRLSGTQMRFFKLHEVDMARAWLEEPDLKAAPQT